MSGFAFSVNSGSWDKIYIPAGSVVRDVYFIDSLTGWATSRGSDSAFVFKTTNGGYNWEYQLRIQDDIYNIQFLDENTGYITSGKNEGAIYKTVNGGVNWDRIAVGAEYLTDMKFVNSNTGWVCSNWYTISKTTDGGASWITQNSSFSPSKVDFINGSTGWFGNNFGEVYRTTNGGINWSFMNYMSNRIIDIDFATKDTGYAVVSHIPDFFVYKTINGGANWTAQSLPSDSSFSEDLMEIYAVNSQLVWLVGRKNVYPQATDRGVIYKTTNGGLNWSYQIPDTSYGIWFYRNIFAMGDSLVWAFGNATGVHSKTGGITSIEFINESTPVNYKLSQNYPNPFNPTTKIKFDIPKGAVVKLRVYDILGREVAELVNEKLNAGVYEYEWNGAGLTSGVYFYRLQAGEFTETKRMVLVK